MPGRRPRTDAVPGKGFEIMMGTLMFLVLGVGGDYYLSTRYNDELLGNIALVSAIILVLLFYRATNVYGGSG